MATLLKAKQIDQLLDAPVVVGGFSFAAGATATVTAALTTSVSTAGRGSVAVPLQVGSSTQHGVVVGAGTLVEVFDSTTKAKLADSAGNEVYGRLTEAAGVYTLSLYSAPAGVEAAYSLGSTTSLDFRYGYRFTFATLPFEAITRSSTTYVGDDPVATGTKLRSETLTPTALNTLPALANTYNANATTGGIFRLLVNGQTYVIADGYTVVGTAVTWTSATVGFDLTTTDKVYALYSV